jgi:glycosyltransferase involved in cell wall biosynthesis
MAAKENQLRVCVVIPAFNESSVIGDVITDITKIFNSSTYNTEVVVVNDASKDQTATVAEQHGATVINHILNSGAGGATATGLRYAELSDFDIAVTMDADGQHLSKDVLTGVDRIIKEDTDLLIGSRLINTDGMSQIKILGNKGLSFITYLLFGINVTDSQSGLRVYSRKAIENLHWKTNGYEFCSEMLWRAKQLHLSVAEYPITAVYTDYSKGKGQNNWNAINIVKSLAQRRLLEIFE